MKYRLGDTVRVELPVTIDFSEEARNKLLRDVLLEIPPDYPTKLVTLTTQEMVDEYNRSGGKLAWD